MPESVRQPSPAEPGGGTVTTAQELDREQAGPDSEPGGGTVTTPQESEEGADRERDEPALGTPGGQTVTSPQELEDAGDA